MIIKLILSMPNIKKLSLIGCDILSFDSIVERLTSLQKLEQLHISTDLTQRLEPVPILLEEISCQVFLQFLKYRKDSGQRLKLLTLGCSQFSRNTLVQLGQYVDAVEIGSKWQLPFC
jgi:hypothetical protein